jgi:hypothetical protein
VSQHPVDALKDLGMPMTPEFEARARAICDEPVDVCIPLEPQWIVNDLGELGVMISGRAFFLYKGRNIEYGTGLHDDGSPMLYRIVGKREFGEVCIPPDWPKGFEKTRRYTRVLVYTPGLSDGEPEDGDWRPLPSNAPRIIPRDKHERAPQ